ncbi:MAG: hypothetical protein EOP50_00205 [Sphingobacteriales bacterium]|nr:MAG: hypothetical protein EOP50_00205 [Sphingobacteriales bacterium]
MRTAKAIVLSTIILGRTHFVATIISTRSFDNRTLVDHTLEPEQAMQFDSVPKANAFIAGMVNPHEREYTVEKISLAAGRVLVSTKKLNGARSSSGAGQLV